MSVSSDKKQKYLLLSRFIAVILVGAIAGLSIFLFFNNSLGWFVNNKNVTGTGMSVEVKGQDAAATYVAYVYNSRSEQLIVNDGSSANPNFINVSGDDGFLELMPFDMIFRSRNRFTPALVKIHLSNINPTYLPSGTISITIDRGVSGLESSSKLDTYVSSIMRFSLVTKSYHENTVLSGVTNKNLVQPSSNSELPDIFNDVYNYTVGSPSPSAVFTTSSGSGPYTYTETDSITLSVSYTSADLVNNELDLYLYVSYDETLTNQSVTTGIGANSSVIGQIDDIEDNITQMIISFGN